jgi:hypothetical protein
MRHKVYPKVRFAGLATALVCVVVVSACSSAGGTFSGASMRHAVVSRSMPGIRVGLTPSISGYAGWCIATTRASTSGKGDDGDGGGGCTGARTSTGPIVVESCSGDQTVSVLKAPVATAYVVVLTRGEVAAVAVAGGRPIPTESNSTLPAGLRAAAIELPGYRIVVPPTVASLWSPCPRVTPFSANGRAIREQGRPANRLAVPLPRRYWYPPARPPSGVCQLASTRLPRETLVIEGIVATRVRPFPELLGQAFISCASTTYFYQNNHDIPTAVLLDAAHPGSVPPGLPGMKPLPGHPSVFEAPPDSFARRIRGAWLVVQEEDNIGPRVPAELLEHLRATIHL